MPVLDVEIVLFPDEYIDENLANKLVDSLGEIFGSAPGTTWLKLWPIKASNYVENGGLPKAGIFPVFVNVMKSVLPVNEQLQREVQLLTEAVANICKRPIENVHIIYQPAASGRVAFGGQVKHL
jgi:phenylpyruvate tautomerase PptA (4-oxalocrotonate tautomerase family)